MLKRQRPVTPPPSFLGDPPLFFAESRPPPSNPADPSQPRSKRQRVRPPPLDGALRGWPDGPTGPHGESDGEEDWTEDACDAVPSLPSATADQYKDTNNLLHELHLLNHHRLLFVHSPRDRCLNPTCHTHIQGPPRTDGLAYNPASLGLADRQGHRIGSVEKGLVEEVQCVRQRYEDANRFLGTLFLSRRREAEGNLR